MRNAPRHFSQACASRGSPAAGQRGFLLITAVMLIVVAALLLSVTVWFPVVGNQVTARHLGSKQAPFIAGSGIERGIRQWSLGNSCAGEGPVSFGEGSFTVTTHTSVWSDSALATAGWVLDEVTGVALPANRHYDRIRLYFDLREQGNNTVVTRRDEIKLSSAGAGLAVQEARREVYQ